MDIQIDTLTQSLAILKTQNTEAQRSGASAPIDENPRPATDIPAQTLSFSCPVDHDGASVYVQGWMRPGLEMPPVILIHDLGESGELYEAAAHAFVRQGFNVFIYDLRGHGRSKSMTGDVETMEELANDLLQVVAWIRHKSHRREPFLISQGVGALLLMQFQKAYPQYAQRCVLLAPIVQVPTALPFFTRIFLRSMAQLMPRARMPGFLLPYLLPVSDESKASGMSSQNLITVSFAYELFQSIRKVTQVFTAINGSNLIICPVDDEQYNSAALHQLIAQHPKPSRLEICEVPGIGSRPLTSNPEQLERLVLVLLPWMQHHSRLTSTL